MAPHRETQTHRDRATERQRECGQYLIKVGNEDSLFSLLFSSQSHIIQSIPTHTPSDSFFLLPIPPSPSPSPSPSPPHHSHSHSHSLFLLIAFPLPLLPFHLVQSCHPVPPHYQVLPVLQSHIGRAKAKSIDLRATTTKATDILAPCLPRTHHPSPSSRGALSSLLSLRKLVLTTHPRPHPTT